MPVHAPLQPANVDPAVGTGASATETPAANDAEQVEPQLIPDGVLETVPVPVPCSDTVSL